MSQKKPPKTKRGKLIARVQGCKELYPDPPKFLSTPIVPKVDGLVCRVNIFG